MIVLVQIAANPEVLTSPLGEVGAKRRVRVCGLSWDLNPLTRFAAQIDLSPLGRGVTERAARPS
jgi:hypothetical protein